MSEPVEVIKPFSESRAVSLRRKIYLYRRKIVPTILKEVYWNALEKLAAARLKSASIAKEEFIKDIGDAIAAQRGYAAAKIGRSQKYWMYYEVFLSKESDPAEIRQYEKELKFHSLKQEGLFPESCDFYLEFNRFYMRHVKNLDCLGMTYWPASMEMELVKYYKLNGKLIPFVLQEPGRTDKQCYLPYFKDKKVLLVCPFAGILKERATKEIFEGVWSKFGKKWFYPVEIDAVEFPYGFAKDTHQKYATVMDLFNFIMGKINQKDFDIALIAAGGLSIPIASTIKNMDKVAIDLGGHLQFIFGVIGQRWRNQEDFKRNYFNEWWIDMPVEYKPKEPDVCDHGAYW
jgi:GT-D fold-like domain